jgi:hypothetical protein
MDQRPIVVFLRLKGILAKAKDIHTEPVQVLGSNAIGSSTETKDLRNDVILQNAPEAEDRSEDQNFSSTDDAILETLETMSFASIRQIAKMTFIPLTTRFRSFTKSLHFVLKGLRSVPH